MTSTIVNRQVVVVAVLPEASFENAMVLLSALNPGQWIWGSSPATADETQDLVERRAKYLALHAAGRVAEADAVASHALDPANGESADVVTLFARLHGTSLIYRGRFAEAEWYLHRALSMSRELCDDEQVRSCLGGLALTRTLRGDQPAAMEALDQLEQAGSSAVDIDDLGLVDRARAWLRAQAGDAIGARAVLADAASRARLHGWSVTEAFLRHDRVRLGAPAEEVRRLDELSTTVGGRLVERFADHARALVARDAFALERVAIAFEEHGALLIAAEASADAAGCYEIQGDARRAAALRRRVGTLIDGIGTVTTPALVGGSGSARLTRREREISAMARAGVSNRAIAAHLVISVRTVENHIQRVYDKLGIRSRAELAALDWSAAS